MLLSTSWQWPQCSDRAPRFSMAMLPSFWDRYFIFHSRDQMCFTKVNHHHNASLQATKKPVAQVLIKNPKLSLFLQTKILIQPLSRVKPKGWCSHSSQQSCSKGQSTGGCRLLSLSMLCCGLQGTGGSLIVLAPCSIGDHGFRTESSPETHRNQECPSWCSSSPSLQWLNCCT